MVIIIIINIIITIIIIIIITITPNHYPVLITKTHFPPSTLQVHDRNQYNNNQPLAEEPRKNAGMTDSSRTK